MMESIIFAFGGAFVRKIYKFFKEKQNIASGFDTEKESLQEQLPNLQVQPENPLWQSNSRLANLANFITMTTRTIITYCLFVLIFASAYTVFKGGNLTELQQQLFNILMTTVLPSLLGYWFIAVPWERMGGGLKSVVGKIIKK